jgi:hypothetical protein
MKREVSAPKLCRAPDREHLPRIGQLSDGGFVVTINEETLEYTVRRFVGEGDNNTLRRGVRPDTGGSSPLRRTAAPRLPDSHRPPPVAELGEGARR